MQSTGFLGVLKRLLFWDYRRGSWQYELIVTLILIFIFATPRAIFRDQPKPKNVVLVQPAGNGASIFWVEPGLLNGVKDTDQQQVIQQVIRSQAGGGSRSVVKIEPNYDDEQELRGYMVTTRP